MRITRIISSIQIQRGWFNSNYFSMMRWNVIMISGCEEKAPRASFITNFRIPEQLAHYLYEWYSKRWGIETGYRQIDNDFKAKTTSKNYCIRLFYFLFSVCLYNLWVLVNICISLILYGRIKDKPIITSKLFTIVLYLAEYENPGGEITWITRNGINS